MSFILFLPYKRLFKSQLLLRGAIVPSVKDIVTIARLLMEAQSGAGSITRLHLLLMVSSAEEEEERLWQFGRCHNHCDHNSDVFTIIAITRRLWQSQWSWWQCQLWQNHNLTILMDPASLRIEMTCWVYWESRWIKFICKLDVGFI